jgi:lipopolysaccharide/colanic/teichoic acid biosynthesis glycosyltransferase
MAVVPAIDSGDYVLTEDCDYDCAGSQLPGQADLVVRYNAEQRLRLAVKPGLTGPMQVYGRGELSLEERIALERDYIENMSLGSDQRMLAMTVAPMLTERGAS